MALHIYRRIGSAFPKSALAWPGKKLKFAGISEDAAEWTGRRFTLSILFSLACSLFYLQFFGETGYAALIAIFMGSLLLIYFIFYLELFFIAHERTKAVERVLPDFLLLMVSNLRAGMPPFSAFVRSARPEFGALYEGIKIATAKLGGKASVEAALEEVSTHFDSPTFNRIAIFFGKGMRAGGQIAKLLERSAEETRKIQDLRNELVAGTRTYSIFLIFIVVMIMPFLLAVSTHFLSTFIAIQGQGTTQYADTGSLPIFTGNVRITPQDMVNISIITLVLTSFLVSALLGVILAGMPPYGIKYFPIIAVASVALFMMMREVISKLISSVVGA